MIDENRLQHDCVLLYWLQHKEWIDKNLPQSIVHVQLNKFNGN